MYQSEAAELWGISPCMPTTLTTPAGAKWVGRQQNFLSLMPTVVKVGMFWQSLMQIWAGDVYSQFGMASSGCFFLVPFSWWGRVWNPSHWFPPCVCWNGFQVFGMLSFTSALVKSPGCFGRSLLLKWRGLKIVFSDLSWSMPLNMVSFCSLQLAIRVVLTSGGVEVSRGNNPAKGCTGKTTNQCDAQTELFVAVLCGGSVFVVSGWVSVVCQWWWFDVPKTKQDIQGSQGKQLLQPARNMGPKGSTMWCRLCSADLWLKGLIWMYQAHLCNAAGMFVVGWPFLLPSVKVDAFSKSLGTLIREVTMLFQNFINW